MLWSFWWLAQLVWDDQTVESHNLLEWVTKVDLVNKNEEQLDLKYESLWRYAALLKLYPWGIANELKQLIRLSVTAFDFLGLFRQPLVLSGPVLRVWVILFDHVLLWHQTGTLTEGDLDLAGVCEIRENQFQVNRFKIFPQRQLAWNCFAALFTVTALIRSTWQCKLIERGKCWITPWSQYRSRWPELFLDEVELLVLFW